MGEGGPPFKLSLPAFLVDRVETLSLAPPTGQKQQSSPRNASLSLADGESLLALAQSDSAPVGWRQIYGKDDIRIWERRVDGYKNKVYMGKALIKAEPETVADLFRTADVKTIQKYNPVYASGYDIAQVDANTKVSWASTKGIFPFQARDFVTTIQYDTQRNGTQLILNHAAEHPSCPPMPKSFVRAKILAGAQACKPRQTDSVSPETDFTFVQHVDMAGKLPAWLLNMVTSVDAPNFVRRVRKCSEEQAGIMGRKRGQRRGISLSIYGGAGAAAAYYVYRRRSKKEK